MKPRIRTIKPEVHLDEELWDVEQASGLPLFRLFTGLWNYADREGRFEWRPRVLKAAILEWWDGDIDAALAALCPKFVVRYEVGGKSYGWVRTFTKHQVINNREGPSTLPAPELALSLTEAEPANDNAASDACPTRDDACLTREVHAPVEGKGRERNGKGTEPARRDASAVAGGGPSEFDSGMVVRAFSALRQQAGGGRYQLKHTDYLRAQSAVEWALEQEPTDPLRVTCESIERFLKHARGKEADGWPFWAWAGDPGRWHSTVAAPGVMGRVMTRDEAEAGARENPAWVRGANGANGEKP